MQQPRLRAIHVRKRRTGLLKAQALRAKGVLSTGTYPNAQPRLTDGGASRGGGSPAGCCYRRGSRHNGILPSAALAGCARRTALSKECHLLQRSDERGRCVPRIEPAVGCCGGLRPESNEGSRVLNQV